MRTVYSVFATNTSAISASTATTTNPNTAELSMVLNPAQNLNLKRAQHTLRRFTDLFKVDTIGCPMFDAGGCPILDARFIAWQGEVSYVVANDRPPLIPGLI